MSEMRSTEAQVAAHLEKIGSASYQVGYGKPPQGSRWAKGQSGNPSGPEQGLTKRALREGVLSAFDEPIERGGADGGRISVSKAFGLKLVQLMTQAPKVSELERFVAVLNMLGMLQEAAKELPGEDKEQLHILRQFFKTIGAPLDALDAFIAAREALTGGAADEIAQRPDQAGHENADQGGGN